MVSAKERHRPIVLLCPRPRAGQSSSESPGCQFANGILYARKVRPIFGALTVPVLHVVAGALWVACYCRHHAGFLCSLGNAKALSSKSLRSVGTPASFMRLPGRSHVILLSRSACERRLPSHRSYTIAAALEMHGELRNRGSRACRALPLERRGDLATAAPCAAWDRSARRAIAEKQRAGTNTAAPVRCFHHRRARAARADRVRGGRRRLQPTRRRGRAPPRSCRPESRRRRPPPLRARRAHRSTAARHSAR